MSGQIMHVWANNADPAQTPQYTASDQEPTPSVTHPAV